MGDVNFFGFFLVVYNIGDFGGDMVALFEGDIRNIIVSINEW